MGEVGKEPVLKEKLFFFFGGGGGKEMAQRVKYLPRKCEDLSSNPQSPRIHLQTHCSYGEVRGRKLGKAPEALGPANRGYNS